MRGKLQITPSAARPASTRRENPPVPHPGPGRAKLDRLLPPIQLPASSLQLPPVEEATLANCSLSTVHCPRSLRTTTALDATELLP